MTAKDKKTEARLAAIESLLEEVVARQELRVQELGGRMERMERVVVGMMGQGVYASDLAVMKKWMGNRWVVAKGGGFGIPKKPKKPKKVRSAKR